MNIVDATDTALYHAAVEIGDEDGDRAHRAVWAFLVELEQLGTGDLTTDNAISDVIAALQTRTKP